MKKNSFSKNKFSTDALLSCKFFLIAFAAIAGCVASQTPSYGQGWEWAKSVGDTTGGFYTNEAMSVVSSGRYVYVTGQFQRPTITFGTTTLINAQPGLNDVFLAKYDSGGNVIWAKAGHGNDDDLSNSVTTDLSGNVYITGVFGSATITFGAFTLINAGGGYNLFFVKYDSSGNVVWAKSAGGGEFDAGNSVATDLSGNVYITGFFRSPTITFGTDTLINAGHDDVFLVKYDSAGNEVWAKSAGDSDYEYAMSVSTDASGGVYITGFFQSPTLSFGTYTLTNTAGSTGNVFLVKYNNSGAVLWAKSSLGTMAGIGSSVTARSPGIVYVTGYFTSPTIAFDTITLTNAGSNNDIFFVKYDSSGNLLWAKSAGGSGNDQAYSLTTDLSGSVYLTGVFGSPTITFGPTTLTNAGQLNMFLIKYAPTGNVIWAKSVGGSNADESRSVATDSSGNVYITGYFASPVLNFGPTTLTNSDWPSIFLAKYNDSSHLPTAIENINNQTLGLRIFPNPVTNELTITSPQPITQIEITNLLGQTVFSNYYQKEQVCVSVSGLASGIYFVKVNGTEIRKFAKE